VITTQSLLNFLAPQHAIKLAYRVQLPRLIISADRRAIDKNLRHRPPLRQPFHLGSFRRIVGDVDLFKRDILRSQQGLCSRAIRTVARRVNNDLGHQIQISRPRKNIIARLRLA